MAQSYVFQDGDWTYTFQKADAPLVGVNDSASKETITAESTQGPFDRYVNIDVGFQPSLTEGKSYRFNQVFAIDVPFLEKEAGGRVIIDTNILLQTKYFDIIYKGKKVTDSTFHIDLVYDSAGYFLVRSQYGGGATYPRDTIDDIGLVPKAAYFNETDPSKIFSPYVGGNPLVWAKSYDSYLVNSKYFDGVYLDLNYVIKPAKGEIFTEQADTVNLGSLSSAQKADAENGADVLNALGGSDVVDLPDRSDWIVAKGLYSYSGQKFFDAGTGADTIRGGDLNDTISGGAGNFTDRLYGGKGADSLYGWGGADTLSGGDHDDTLDGGTGNDTLEGGGGTNTAVFSGDGKDYTLFFVNPLAWKSRGPDGSDTLSLIQKLRFDNKETTVDDLFQRLVQREDVASFAAEQKKLIKKNAILSEAIATAEDLIENSKTIKSTADAAIAVKSMQFVLGGLASLVNPLYGFALATGNLAVDLFSLEHEKKATATQRQLKVAEAVVENYWDVIGDLFAKTSEVVTIIKAGLAIRDLVKFNDDWKSAHSQLVSAIDQLKTWREKQSGLVDRIKKLEIELRDKDGSGSGLPKVRYDGENTTTPSVIDDIAAVKAPNALSVGLATLNAGTGTVNSWATYALAGQQKNLTLLGSMDTGGVGSSVANKLTGNSGSNNLYGGSGNDTLAGGKGADKLWGGDGKKGSGNDTFVFKATSDSTVSSKGRDTIYDFAKGDRFDLSTIDANSKKGGNQAFSFIGTDKFSGHADELRYDKAKSDTYVYADVNGDKVADFAFHLDDAVKLVSADFLL